MLPLTPPETQKLAAWEPAVHFVHRMARIWTRLLAIWGVIQQTVYHHPGFSSVDEIKRAMVKSMAETTAWRSHCQFCNSSLLSAFYLRLMLFARCRHYFPRLIQINYGMMFSMKRTWFMPNLVNVFNISKVIGRKKVAQVFLTHSVYLGMVAWLSRNALVSNRSSGPVLGWVTVCGRLNNLGM